MNPIQILNPELTYTSKTNWEEFAHPSTLTLFPKNGSYDLKRALQALGSPYESFSKFQTKAMIAIVTYTPVSIIESIIKFKNDPTAPGYMIIRGFPTDSELPSTPSDGTTSSLKKTFVSEGVNVGVSSLLGEIFGYRAEKSGALIHNVCPVEKSKFLLSNESSEVDFRFHVDNSFFSYRPHFLNLFCLREDKTGKAATNLANIKDALAIMNEEDQLLLRKPLFQLRTPRSFQKSDTNEQWTDPTPVIFGPAESPEARFSFNGLKAINIEGTECLERLEAALRSELISKKWFSKPGDLILINNRKAVHGRTPFTANYDGYDRWLQRIYTHSDPWLSRECESEKLTFAWRKS